MNDTPWCDWARMKMALYRISVTEVAKEAGVSRVTTSRVINGRSVSEETFLKIQNALSSLILREKSDNQSA